MRLWITEFIGTFFLVVTIGLCVTNPSETAQSFAPIAIGSALMIMVYMGGHVSGGHYNPAVSLAAMLRGALSPAQIVPYWVSQILGAFAAAAVTYYVRGRTFSVNPGEHVAIGQALLVEAMYTFALALVVLNVATAKKTAGNSYYGLAIGFTVVVAAFAGGGISGGAFNPAVAIGPAIAEAMWKEHGTGLANLWIYLVGPLAGGAAAAGVFRIQEEAGNAS